MSNRLANSAIAYLQKQRDKALNIDKIKIIDAQIANLERMIKEADEADKKLRNEK